MKNGLIGGLIVALVVMVGWALFYKQPVLTVLPTPTAVVTASTQPSLTGTPTAGIATPTPATTANLKGTINGKLCYPSSFLPKGALEAKNTSTNAVYTQVYPGSQNGGKTNYSFELPAATYILRYKAQASVDTTIYGYHTEVCPTGVEPSCAADNARVNIKVTVKAGETVNNVDLCDFYYDQNTPPSF